jgi:hypothetical protein
MKKVPMSAMGNVSPVMTVERQEFRNKNTMQCALEQGSTDVGDSHSNLPRTIGNGSQFDPQWQLRLKLGQSFAWYKLVR